MSSIHIRYDGQTYEEDFEEVFREDRLESIGISNASLVNSQNVSADNVKTAVAEFLDIDIDELVDYEVEFHKNSNITVRPSAVFG